MRVWLAKVLHDCQAKVVHICWICKGRLSQLDQISAPKNRNRNAFRALRAQRVKKIKIALRDWNFQARSKISSEPPTKPLFLRGGPVSSKTKGRGEQGAAGYFPKILLLKRAVLWCSVPSIRVIGKSALEIGRPVSETKFLEDFCGPLSLPAPFEGQDWKFQTRLKFPKGPKIEKNSISIEFFSNLVLENVNLAWNIQSRPSEFPSKIGVWWAARLKFSISLEYFKILNVFHLWALRVYRAPNQEIRKMPFFETKKWTFGGPHLDPFK